MDKEDRDIRKEIEELEKLIEQVKMQNEEEKKKQNKKPGNEKQIVVKINLGMEYSNNVFINLAVSFFVNFLVVLALLSVFDFAYYSHISYIFLIAIILTLYEEIYRRHLTKYFLSLVIFSSGLIFFLMNLLLFYFLDLAIFQSNFYFNSYWDPIVFVMFLHFIRFVLKAIITHLKRTINLKGLRRR